MVDFAALLNKKKQEVTDRQAGRANAYKFKLAETEIRILPSWRPADHEEAEVFFHDFGQAWIKDMDDNVLAVIGDRKITYGEDDEVRNLIQRAIAGGKTDAQRLHYKNMLAKPRVLCGGLVLNDPDVDPTEPQILDFSESQWTGPITDLIVDAAKEGDNVIDLENGFNMTVKKSGKGFDTKYSFTLARKSSKVDRKVMEKIQDIDAFIRAKFVDGERAVNAIKAVTQGEPLALVDKTTDLGASRSERVTTSEVVDADYSVLDDATDTTVGGFASVTVSDEEIDALFD